jgi:Fe-S-cluster containining protein
MDGSCCTLRAENNDGLPAPVSEVEIKRILTFAKGKKREDFLDKRPTSPQFANQMSILFPDMIESIHKIFPAHESHFELKTIGDSCFFKEIEGCRLPDEARPNFCKIYPFWFFHDDPHVFQDANCLALERCQTIPEVLLSLGTNPEKLKHIFAQICDEWGLYRLIPQRKKRIFL